MFTIMESRICNLDVMCVDQEEGPPSVQRVSLLKRRKFEDKPLEISKRVRRKLNFALEGEPSSPSSDVCNRTIHFDNMENLINLSCERPLCTTNYVHYRM